MLQACSTGHRIERNWGKIENVKQKNHTTKAVDTNNNNKVTNKLLSGRKNKRKKQEIEK